MLVKILTLVLLLTSPAVFAKRKPIPPQLTNAKTVRLTCNGQPCEEPILSAARKTLEKWGRYGVILDGKNADLILSFEIGSPQEGLAHYEVLSPAGSGSVSDIATQQAPRMQEIRKRWTFSILDGDDKTHPKLMEIQDVFSNDDASAAKDLIYRLKREVGKGRQ